MKGVFVAGARSSGSNALVPGAMVDMANDTTGDKCSFYSVQGNFGDG